MRLQHASVDTHLSVLRSEIPLLVHTSTKRMTIEGMPTVVSIAKDVYRPQKGVMVRVNANRPIMMETSTIEAIARPQMARRRFSVAGMSTSFWKGRS